MDCPKVFSQTLRVAGGGWEHVTEFVQRKMGTATNSLPVMALETKYLD